MAIEDYDNKIIPFGNKPPTIEPPKDTRDAIWTCAACASQTFFLHATGQTECVGCNLLSNDADIESDTLWRERKPPVPAEIEEINPTNTMIRHLGPALIKKEFSGAVLNDDNIALCVVGREGDMKMWCEGVDTPEQLEWFRSRLETFETFVTKKSLTYKPEDKHRQA